MRRSILLNRSSEPLTAFPRRLHVAALSATCLVALYCAGSPNEHSAVHIGSLLVVDTMVYVGSDAADATSFIHAAATRAHLYVHFPALLRGDSVFGVVRHRRTGVATPDTLWFWLPPGTREGTTYIRSFAVSDTTCSILKWKALLVYRIESWRPHSSKDAIPPVWVRNLTTSYDEVRAFNDEIALLKCSVGEPRAADLTRVLRLGIDGSFAGESALDIPYGVELTMFIPRRAIAVSSDHAAVADLMRYRIVVYNRNGEATDTLTRTPVEWRRIAHSEYAPVPHDQLLVKSPKDGRRLRAVMERARDVAYTAGAIRLVDFVNNTTLLVAYATGKKLKHGLLESRPDVRYDLWRLQHGKWRVISLDVPDFNPDGSETLSSGRLFPLGYSYSPAGNEDIAFYQVQPVRPVTWGSTTYSEFVESNSEEDSAGETPYSVVFYRLR